MGLAVALVMALVMGVGQVLVVLEWHRQPIP